MRRVAWRCPKCKTGASSRHGKGGATACQYSQDDCNGFLCECDQEGDTKHGTYDDPCLTANCYHCGWGGTFPLPRWTAAELPSWARTALKAEWTPPAEWVPPKRVRP